MPGQKIYRYISLLLLSLAALTVAGQEPEPQAAEGGKMPWISGAAVSADLVGVSMKLVGARFANMEIAGRINIKEKFFPIFEIGIGDCSRHGGENSNIFSCTSPYYRIGVDYNVNKKMNGNRFLVGARYGISRYDYDFTADGMADPVYGTDVPLNLTGLDGRNQWLELVVGVETKLWKLVRLGWNLRYKMRLSQKISEYGEPYFVPGYGKNDISCFGGSVNLVFDLGKGSWSRKPVNRTIKEE